MQVTACSTTNSIVMNIAEVGELMVRVRLDAGCRDVGPGTARPDRNITPPRLDSP